MKEIDVAVRDATLSLQVIHTSLTEGTHTPRPIRSIDLNRFRQK